MEGSTVRAAIPSTATLAGLFFALWSMVSVADGHFTQAAVLIWIAAMMDLVDGGLARALNAISPFGKDLDSLVDFAAAGVAPAFFLHTVYFADWGWAGLFPPFLWAGFVGVRLARFNTAPVMYPHHFQGVPCPPAATIVVHYYLFSTATFDEVGSPVVSLVLITCVGLLMVSNVRYEKARWLAPSRILRNSYGIGTLVMIVALPFFPKQALFVVTTASAIRAVIRHLLRDDGPMFAISPPERLLPQRGALGD